MIAALRLGKVFFNTLQDGRSGISGRAIHTSSHISRTRTDFAVQPDQLEIGLFWNGIIFVVTQSVGARNEFVLDVLHLLVHGFDSLQQFGVGIGFALLLFRPLCCVVGFLFLLRRSLRHALAPAQHARNHIELLAHPFQFVGGFRSFRDVVADAQLQFEGSRQILVAYVNIGVFDDGQRLRETLSIHSKPNRVFSG